MPQPRSTSASLLKANATRRTSASEGCSSMVPVRNIRADGPLRTPSEGMGTSTSTLMVGASGSSAAGASGAASSATSSLSSSALSFEKTMVTVDSSSVMETMLRFSMVSILPLLLSGQFGKCKTFPAGVTSRCRSP